LKGLPVQGFENAYYVKLGKGGSWEAESIEKGLLRIGWSEQSLVEINAGRWDLIEKQLRDATPDRPGIATNDLNRLKEIAQSTPADVWITFHASKLWWARLLPGPVEGDSISKFRRIQGSWRDESISGKVLVTSDLPGKIAQLQGFRGTVCRVKENAVLQRVIEGTRSELATKISAARAEMSGLIEQAIRALHWKDYETLIDLVFRDAGWIRISILGQQVKAFDLELREPITGDRYAVQVKSQANRADLNHTIKDFPIKDFRKLFFVVHTPADDLKDAEDIPSHVELVDPSHLADLVMDAGLVQWVEYKAA